MAENYVLPKSTTNCSQKSIKYTGPKAWAEVPKEIKDIAFRKPFSKKCKEHVLKTIFVELPPKSKDIFVNDNKCDELRLLFETDTDDEDFLGFTISEKTD